MEKTSKKAPRAKKSWGQNFLKNPLVFEPIIRRLSSIYPSVIEIGPGTGSLTGVLLNYFSEVHAIEKERDVISYLKEHFTEYQGKFFLYEQDVLEFDFSSMGEELCIFGNIPYYITAPILEQIYVNENIQKAVILMQKEVAARLVCDVASRESSPLTYTFALDFNVDKLFTLGPKSFRPAPKVDSTAVLLSRRKSSLDKEIRLIYRELVKNAFQQRRKKIKNSLSAFLNDEEIKSVGVDPLLRAENLEIADYLSLAKLLLGKRGND